MDLVERCEQIAASYAERSREQALTEVRAAVACCLAWLEDSGRLAILAAHDREWIVEHVEVQVDLLLLRVIDEGDIQQLVDEALRDRDLPARLAPLPFTLAEGECWQAVKVGGNLYCCDCRSLYEGTPYRSGEIDTLSEETAPSCAACGMEL
jgi:hypothetical protein